MKAHGRVSDDNDETTARADRWSAGPEGTNAHMRLTVSRHPSGAAR